MLNDNKYKKRNTPMVGVHMFCLMMHSTHFIHGYGASDIWLRKEGFYLTTHSTHFIYVEIGRCIKYVHGGPIEVFPVPVSAPRLV